MHSKAQPEQHPQSIEDIFNFISLSSSRRVIILPKQQASTSHLGEKFGDLDPSVESESNYNDCKSQKCTVNVNHLRAPCCVLQHPKVSSYASKNGGARTESWTPGGSGGGALMFEP
jgi:hypothetical protein